MNTPTEIQPLSVVEPTDPRVAAFVRLRDVETRVTGMFIVESEFTLRRLLENGQQFEEILLTESRYARLEIALQNFAVSARIFVAPDAVVNEIVGFPLHRGVLALARRPMEVAPHEILPSSRGVAVVLENVVDPSNVGSVFRHAAGFGANAVVLTHQAGDPLFRKSVRASMGWALAVPHTRLGPQESIREALNPLGYLCVALTPDRSARPLDQVLSTISPKRSIALLVGTETSGLRHDTIAEADCRARIPMSDHVDSFNVATAAAIALYEVRRFRPL